MEPLTIFAAGLALGTVMGIIISMFIERKL